MDKEMMELVAALGAMTPREIEALGKLVGDENVAKMQAVIADFEEVLSEANDKIVQGAEAHLRDSGN